MLTRRVIVCLDVKGGRVVKGTQFVQLRDVGDPVELATRYEDEGADEIMFLDISASAEERGTLLDVARRTAERLFVPLTIGGGVRTADDVGRALRAGADKVSINSAAVVAARGAHRGGRAVRGAVRGGEHRRASTDGDDVARVREGRPRGRRRSTRWSGRWSACARGAGEILLTSIDRDGARTGYDLALTRAVADAVRGAGHRLGRRGRRRRTSARCCAEAGADAALVAGILHDGVTTRARDQGRDARRGASGARGMSIRRPERRDARGRRV